MAITTPTTDRSDTLPWPGLLVLGAAALTMVTAEMLPTAVLAPMSAGLGVDDARTARLVSVWAAVVVVASFPLVRLTRRWDKRSVVVGALLVLAASSVLTALAPTYAAALGARLVGAAAVGLLWSTLNAQVADLVSDRLLGPAIAVVLGGATLGMVLGTPLARVVADVAGWRTAFVVLAGLGLVVAVLVRIVVPRGAPVEVGGPAADGHASPRPMLVVTGLVGLVLVGHYGAYTFITRLAEHPADVLPGGVGTLLLVFGVASAVGVALAGRVARTLTGLLVAVGLTAAALLGLAVADHAWIGVGVVVAWGVASGALPPLAQTEILRLAGPGHRATAGALIPVVFNGGIAVGAALASLLVDRGGVAALPVPTAIIVGIAALGLVLVRR
ncbi:MFS transporter [Nocardioides sp.]|uniref:MFS transporter n=1 Tax=Nocardioides sp. TaxID=35761 RepID=UPI0039E37737